MKKFLIGALAALTVAGGAVAASAANFALDATTTASSVEPTTEFTADLATDGDLNTRWASDYTDDEWIIVDMGGPKAIGYIAIYWEAAYSSDYTIYTTSNDLGPDDSWETLSVASAQDAGDFDEVEIDGVKTRVAEYTFDTTTFRKIMIRSSARATGWGNSIREIVIGKTKEAANEAANTANSAYPSSGYKPADGSVILPTNNLIGLEEGWGGNAAAGRAAAFDGNVDTYFDPLGTGDGYAGIDAGKEYKLTAILVHPRDGQLPRFMGASIEGSNDMENWDTIWVSVDEAEEFAWYTIEESDFDDNGSYRYFRYFNMTNHGDVGDVELYGVPSDGVYESTGAAAAATAYPTSGYKPAEGSSILPTNNLIGLEEGWGGNAAAGRDAAFDGDVDTFFDPLGTGDGYAGIDAGTEYTLTAILIHPRDGQLPRFMGATIEGSNDMENWETIWVSVDEAEEFTWYTIDAADFDDNGSYRYFRYFNMTNHGDVADVELYGYPTNGTPAVEEAPVVEETPVVEEPVVEEAPVEEVVEETVVEEPVVEEVVETPAETEAPQTFDVAVIAAVAAVISGAGYAVAKKKNH